ncbi:MAG: TVP38/TMEM64 family protein [Rhizomicrobium sp.]
MKTKTSNAQDQGRPRSWVRVLALPVAIALGFAAVIFLHVDRYVSFGALAANRVMLLAEVARHPVLTAVLFAAVYVLVTTLSLPGTSLLTMSGGFLFGRVLGTAIIVLAATFGAGVLYVIARTSFGEVLRGRAMGALDRLKAGFQHDAFSYLLFLRLVPLFPFWLINLVCALLDVPFPTFVMATFVGIIPGTAVYASVGSGIGTLIAQGRKPDLNSALTPQVLAPLVALAVLALAPVAYRHLRQPRN